MAVGLKGTPVGWWGVYSVNKAGRVGKLPHGQYPGREQAERDAESRRLAPTYFGYVEARFVVQQIDKVR
jgi:hypothetical protein